MWELNSGTGEVPHTCAIVKLAITDVTASTWSQLSEAASEPSQVSPVWDGWLCSGVVKEGTFIGIIIHIVQWRDSFHCEVCFMTRVLSTDT